jgi:flagellar capping protein FliD
MMANDGPILSRNEQATRQLQNAEEDMADLKVRMDGVYERYLKQLSVMDGVVSQMNALRESLKGQFENLAAAYNNK